MISDTITDVLLIFVLFIVFVLYYLYSTNNLITYYIDHSNESFLAETRHILLTSTINSKYKLRETDNISTADIVIYYRTRDEMIKMNPAKPEYYPGTNKKINFSWTYQYPKPRIYIDELNWLHGVTESGLSITEYRQYVIQHEFLHALGFDHQPCNKETAPNGVCPVLYQSTRGCPNGFKCGYQVTPFDYNKKINNSYF
jgi:hypothetical protein